MAIKILIVEDDNTMRTLIHKLLRFEGFEVKELSNDEDLNGILSAIRREKPTAILLDVHLTQIDGFELLHCIRRDQDIKDTYVIMSSGIDLGERCLSEGANRFLLKPCMPEDLINEIHKAVREYNWRNRV